MALPLEGIKVVDSSQIIAGPCTAMLLADQGADVIKLEPPGGESYRTVYTSPKLEPFGKGFLVLNRNKRSIMIDLTTEEGRGVLQRLASWADVFISNLQPHRAERFGATYEILSKANPNLIYAAISAFGEFGPDAGRPAYDQVIQARAGIVSQRRMPDGTPVTPSTMTSDITSAMTLAYAIMTALWERERTGKGRLVDISLLGMALAVQAPHIVRVEGDDTPLPGKNLNATASPYECSDGRWLMLVAMTEAQWTGLCEVLEVEHLVNDPLFQSYDLRSRNTPELSEILRGIFGTRPRAEWVRKLQAANIPSGPVQEREEIFDDPQVVLNSLITKTDHPSLGETEMIGFPFKLSGQDLGERMRRPAPRPGEHSVEVLHILGYDTSQTEQLISAGVVLES